MSEPITFDRHPDPKQHQQDGALNEDTFKQSAEAWFDTAMLVG